MTPREEALLEIGRKAREAASALALISEVWSEAGIESDAFGDAYPFALDLDEQVAEIFAFAEHAEALVF